MRGKSKFYLKCKNNLKKGCFFDFIIYYLTVTLEREITINIINPTPTIDPTIIKISVAVFMLSAIVKVKVDDIPIWSTMLTLYDATSEKVGRTSPF